MKDKFKYIGLTPARGKIFRKGKIELVIYWDGEKRLWPNGSPGKMWKRDKTGMDFHFPSNY